MSRWWESLPIRRTAVAGVVGLLVTVAVLSVPSLRFAYRSLAGHLVLETTVTLVAALAGLLLYGRYRRSGALADLLLVYAMALISGAALVLVTLPALLGETTGTTASSWAALVVRFVGALLIMIAALVPDRRIYRAARPVRQAVAAAAVLILITLVVLVLATQLPEAVDVRLAPEESARPTLQGHPLVLVVQLGNFFCFAVAAVAFTRRAARLGDDLLAWFGAASALGAWARVHYLLFPSLYTEWLYVGDLFRLGFYVLLLVGVVREIQEYWAAQADAAAEAERRRLARDLHDGVVQELGYIRQLASRTRTAESDVADHIISAADRAIDESRRSISALTAEADEPLSTVLRRSVCDVGDRYDVPVHFEVEREPAVSPDEREAILRIVREAVSNAARHAAASGIWVVLASDVVTIRDDGRGFEPGGKRRDGSFGLVSMRERAAAMGAGLDVQSAPGEGTEVKVTW